MAQFAFASTEILSNPHADTDRIGGQSGPVCFAACPACCSVLPLCHVYTCDGDLVCIAICCTVQVQCVRARSQCSETMSGKEPAPALSSPGPSTGLFGSNALDWGDTESDGDDAFPVGSVSFGQMGAKPDGIAAVTKDIQALLQSRARKEEPPVTKAVAQGQPQDAKQSARYQSAPTALIPLPCYELYWVEDETQKKNKDLSHEEALLKAYLEENPGEASRILNPRESLQESLTTEEEYEVNPEKTFMAFASMVAAWPEALLRYSTEPVWVKPLASAVACPGCSGKRHRHMFQLLPYFWIQYRSLI
ncbi:hypothetical protein HDU91_006662, partial [Kappamyces sp. JEL0680]